jgi:hypothetical protein
MPNPACSGETSRDLFGDVPSKRLRRPIIPHRVPPELVSARALCAQLRRTQALPDKQRIVHLICLNLVSMLKNGTRR